MGDSSHLESMGRELKCPICLSLLNSAMSLTCNHIFCNSCIMKSMKSGSSCPVCKVPYQRREIRPAPHMDNLVNIYKSMEVASGINIFVTQNASCAKSSGNENAGGSCSDKAKSQCKSKNNKSRNDVMSNRKSSGSISDKPSFPTKKRVQVPQHPLSEPPTRKPESGCEESKKHEVKESSNTLKENSTCNRKGEAVLAPFFWLREEDDVNNSSQHTDKNEDGDVPLPDVPSFSDIKDSDDENYSKGELCATSNRADLFDSEIFEWTQKACSPELCSSPVEIQVPGSEKIDGNKDNEPVESFQDTETNKDRCTVSPASLRTEKGSGSAESSSCDASPQKAKVDIGHGGNKESKKRGRKGTKAVRMKFSKENADKLFGSSLDLEEVPENLDEMKDIDKKGTSDLKKTSKRSKQVKRSSGATTSTPQHVTDSLAGIDIPNQSDKASIMELGTSLDVIQDTGGDLILKTSEQSRKVSMQDNLELVKKHRFSKTLSGLNQDGKKFGNCTEKFIKCIRKRKSAMKSSSSALSSCKKLKSSSTCVLKKDSENHVQEDINDASAKVIEPNKIQSNPDARATEILSTKENSNRGDGAVLHKCAFCLSSEESEAIGHMVHYCNGRPVPADYNGETKLIHSHRNCAEWAPNVYFEDDIAINLDAELARSRRIKCCLCGHKGAALGCYEKSCRKSFHVPCAKLISQCRWDAENFVMLCPLHASSKLPSEKGVSPEKGNKSDAKGRSRAPCDPVASKRDTCTKQNWNSRGRSDKMVICCSALSVAEKETISGFEKLSGAKVLKKYDSSVTHVITSTDENGACRRTIKFMMGILEGKWILNIEWVEACVKTKEHVPEEKYEIAVDIHGVRDGPRLGRHRLLNKQPKLFDGGKFYLMGDFTPSYKGYLQDLIVAGGGNVLHRKPIPRDQETQLSILATSPVFIIYSLELPEKSDLNQKNVIVSCRLSNAEALASSTGSTAVSNSWVLDSIAACRLQSL